MTRRSKNPRPRLLIGSSPVMQRLRGLIALYAQSDLVVVIHGETGTGKELVARGIHDQSSRASGPFCAVNCANIPVARAEAILFGHRRGAFTGADEDRLGVFEEADGGTLFLDEIAELPLEVQAKLLRALEEQAVVPVGATREKRVDVRVIAATHRRLPDAVAEGRFRQDLLFRLWELPLDVPSLEERREDIPEIVRAVADAERWNCEWSDDLWRAVKGQSYPGNVRQLLSLARWVALENPSALEVSAWVGKTGGGLLSAAR